MIVVLAAAGLLLVACAQLLKLAAPSALSALQLPAAPLQAGALTALIALAAGLAIVTNPKRSRRTPERAAAPVRASNVVPFPKASARHFTAPRGRAS